LTPAGKADAKSAVSGQFEDLVLLQKTYCLGLPMGSLAYTVKGILVEGSLRCYPRKLHRPNYRWVSKKSLIAPVDIPNTCGQIDLLHHGELRDESAGFLVRR
jgi:hypothetical protein